MESLKDYIKGELNFSRRTNLRVYGQTGQEIIDDEELPNVQFAFFTMESRCLNEYR